MVSQFGGPLLVDTGIETWEFGLRHTRNVMLIGSSRRYEYAAHEE